MTQINEWLEEIKRKMQFVNLKLKPMMVALHTGVTDVEYRVFKHKDDTDGDGEVYNVDLGEEKRTRISASAKYNNNGFQFGMGASIKF